MSGWDQYIKALVSGPITGGAIYGQGKPCGLWAASSATYIKADEVQALHNALCDNTAFEGMSGTGFKVNGVKFMKLQSELGKVIRGKQGENATVAAFSKKAVIIATGKGTPQEVGLLVEKMAADLSGKGF